MNGVSRTLRSTRGQPNPRLCIRPPVGSRVRLVDGLAAVSVIGAGINGTYANVRAGAETLDAAGISQVGTATSSFRITWMIPRDRTRDAVQALHRRFIETVQVIVPE